MPHFGHIFVLAIVEEMTAVLISMRAISSRSGIVWRVIYRRAANVVTDACGGGHTVGDMEPDVPSNMEFLLAFERTHAVVQSFCVNAGAP